ncbi:hypothetical protein [Gramella sp. AN32]|uniref:Photosystem I assembly protein Ycf4 n=1 Tax=Christiangramia antarctica TaxID=2058158 RepID=A0ABW5X3Q3_9FLAO|nr:hypothetical protein [Gramella sp. AN32]MCM4156300.1 hypothetical protein [Gramella sp. AN32]
MALGTLIFLALLAGGFYLAKRFGLIFWFITLINTRKAKFTRRNNSGNSVFDISPARPSWTLILICLILYLIGNWIFQIDTASGHPGTVAYLIWIFIPVFLFFLLIGARYRRPAQLTISDKELADGKNSWGFPEIAGFYIRKGSRRGEEEVGSSLSIDPWTGMVFGGKSTSALLGKFLGGKMAQRSYLLTMRTRQGSREIVLAGGLTLETAEALLQDLTEVIKPHS